MGLPALTDAQIKSERPLTEAVTKDGLAARDRWNRSVGTGGAGVQPTVAAFEAVMVGHSHNGDPGQAHPVPTAGIAAAAVNLSTMIDSNSVSQDKVDDETMGTGNLSTQAATSGKLHGAQFDSVAATTWVYGAAGVLEPGDDFKGQTWIVANPLSRECVVRPALIATAEAGEFHVRGFCNSSGTLNAAFTHVRLGINQVLVYARYGTAGFVHYSLEFF